MGNIGRLFRFVSLGIVHTPADSKATTLVRMNIRLRQIRCKKLILEVAWFGKRWRGLYNSGLGMRQLHDLTGSRSTAALLIRQRSLLMITSQKPKITQIQLTCTFPLCREGRQCVSGARQSLVGSVLFLASRAMHRVVRLLQLFSCDYHHVNNLVLVEFVVTMSAVKNKKVSLDGVEEFSHEKRPDDSLFCMHPVKGE